MLNVSVQSENLGSIMRSAMGPAIAVVASALVILLAYGALGRLGRISGRRILQAIAKQTRWPVLILVEALVLTESVSTVISRPDIQSVAREVLALIAIAATAWLAIRAFDVFHVALLERYRIDVTDNLRARKIHTQFQVIRTVVVVAIVIITIAAMLMTFDRVRQLGIGIMASAGIVGIVVGMAAQPLLGNILASLQIALTEPIRIDDVVIVEGEWGRIEEITLTYVVVRIWDLRRMVLPISYFTQHPFQNWTRVTADLLGTVYLYVDYTVPVGAIREEVHAAVQDAPQWDGKVWGLQVTDSTEHTMQLRALMSAGNSSDAWDLRCAVRERLIRFLQEHYPAALPKSRVVLEQD